MIKKFLIFLIVLTINWGTLLSNDEVASYEFYRCYKVVPETAEQKQIIEHMKHNSDSFIILSEVGDSEPLHIIVPPHKFAPFSNLLTTNNFNYTLISENLEADFIQPIKNVISSNEKPNEFGWDKYYPLDNVENWIKSLSEKYSEHIKLITIGKSHLGRDIFAIKLSYNDRNPNILIDGGAYGNNWFSVSIATFILNELLTNSEQRIRTMAENYNWFIVPVINPDGYKYSMERNILWRKTLKPNGPCIGTDPNRNWNISWNSVENNVFPCTDRYPGAEPFSETETRSYSKFITENLKDNVELYISYHPYGNKILFPYAHTEQKPNNYDSLLEIASNRIMQLIPNLAGMKINSFNKAVGLKTGTSFDWIFKKMNAKLAYTYQLEIDTEDVKNFILPTSLIQESCKRNFEAIVEFVVQINETNAIMRN